ncbi:MAG: CsgG/HfaB family protein [Planctomycetota bacterium]
MRSMEFPLTVLITMFVLMIPPATGQETTTQEPTSETATKQTTAQQPAAEKPVYPAAIFPFKERGAEVEGLGVQVADLLFASLVSSDDIYLVDREDMNKTLAEQQLSVSGLVNPKEAVKIGQMTGARLLLTGAVMQVGNNTHIVAKVIGTETTRVVGASAKGGPDEELDTIIEELGEKIQKVVKRDSSKLVPKTVKKQDRIANLKKKLGKSEPRTLQINIAEQHVGRNVIDPAAETEFTLYAQGSGFNVLDTSANSKKADIIVTGEGFSEFATRLGNMSSVRARVEIKAVERKTGKILAMDRQTKVAVGLSENVTAKQALQEAAADLAERMLPRLANSK